MIHHDSATNTHLLHCADKSHSWLPRRDPEKYSIKGQGKWQDQHYPLLLFFAMSQETTKANYFTYAVAPSALGRYRALSKLAGVHVSPIALGAMSIGDKWDTIGFGSMNKESSFKLLDAYFQVRWPCSIATSRSPTQLDTIGRRKFHRYG